MNEFSFDFKLDKEFCLVLTHQPVIDMERVPKVEESTVSQTWPGNL